MVIKKKRKKKDTETRKQRRRVSNLVHLHLQETSWPLHHSDAHDVKNYVIIIKLFFSAIDVV